MNEDSKSDLEIKINRLLDGELDEAGVEEMQRRLLRDPEAHAMLRACRELDGECRDAMETVLGPDRADTPMAVQAGGRLGIWASAAAAAAAVVLGVALWSIFTSSSERPGPAGDIARITDNTIPPTSRPVEFVTDRFDPTPPAEAAIRPVRHVDRFPVGVFDAESGQLRVFLVDHEQEQRGAQWLDL